VVVVNEAMAAALWPNENAIGKCIKVGADTAPCRAVVGVAENVKFGAIGGEQPDLIFHLPIAQAGENRGSLFLRVRGNVVAASEAIRRDLQRAMPGSAYLQARPFDSVLAPVTRSWRLGATMFAIFGGLALVLATIGLYSVIAYSVTQRTHEMGVRIALGARVADVVTMIVRDALAVVLLGVGIGVGLALSAGHWLAPLLFQVSPHDPRAFGAGLKMAKYTLTDSQLEAMTTALLAQTDRAGTLPKDLIRPAASPSNYHPGGDAGRLMEDLRCQSCHAINGNGGDMAPDLSREGSAVQSAWLTEFMRNPNTLRPALIRRMPKFNLTTAENKTISDYILSAYQAPGFDSHTLDPHILKAGAVGRGRELFYTKYACQSCHIADYKKDKGYVGPPLVAVGNRRPAVWIYKMVKDPHDVVPGTFMPNPNLSDNEAYDLTAFLMTLKAKENGGGK
jgi:mono/diheme cytochrome c family protein